MSYDFLIVGAGLFGSVCARELTDRGFSCLVIEKKNHIAGNCFTENVDGIDVHKYGPHIFHTSNEKIWNYINQFGKFNNFELNVIASHKDKLYSLPFNMWTFYQMWGTRDIDEIKKIIDSQRFIGTPSNLEEYALSIVGKDIYYSLIYGYTKKQWKTDPKNLPADIIKRLPLRFVFDNNYFNDTYQGIPQNGYTSIFRNLLDGIQVELGIDFFSKRPYFEKLATKVIYTGPIDLFFEYCHGTLDYRSLYFDHARVEKEDIQSTPVINYTEESIPYTRIVEHKHFKPKAPATNHTIITKEYPIEYTEFTEPMYPINNKLNMSVYDKYVETSYKHSKVIFGGRLAEYKYYDMHQIIGSALKTIQKIL